MMVLTALHPQSSLKCDVLSFTLKRKVLEPSVATGAHTQLGTRVLGWAGATAEHPGPEDRALWGCPTYADGSPLRLPACGEHFLLFQELGKASKLKLKLERVKKHDFRTCPGGPVLKTLHGH